MTRLSLLLGLFLSFATAGVVFLLSLLAQVTVPTLVFRTLTVFFAFGFAGVALGSYLEVVLMPGTLRQVQEKVAIEVKLEDQTIEAELGDLLTGQHSATRPLDAKKPGAPDLQPAVFPRMTVEGGKVVSRGDSAVVS
jgi:hypothetical protein